MTLSREGQEHSDVSQPPAPKGFRQAVLDYMTPPSCVRKGTDSTEVRNGTDSKAKRIAPKATLSLEASTKSCLAPGPKRRGA